ncbi:MAG: fasciclin domain-containing protein [Bacteroidia bacterium]|nr:fasciclin domain-containing protein [Bacteroidia bacterium]
MKNLKFLSTLLSIFFVAVFFTSCSEYSDLHNNKANRSNVEMEEANPSEQEELSVVGTALSVNAATKTETEPGEFSTLIAALVYTDLVGAVDAFGQVTVFAPTDAAFADLGLNATNISSKFAGDDGKAALSNILLYHLKTGRQASTPVLNKKQIRMVNGGFTYPDSSLPGLEANNSTAGFVLDLIDISASNGIIHVIDAVLLP